MVARRPLVIDAGTIKELPVGDSVIDREEAAGKFPFFTSSGESKPIALTLDQKLPFFLSNGSQSNISMV